MVWRCGDAASRVCNGIALAGKGSVKTFVAGAPVPRTERILRIQGYSNFEAIRPGIWRSAKAMAGLAVELSAPTVAYRRATITRSQAELLEVEGGVRFHCGAFPRRLAGCTAVVVFVLTLGPRLDEHVVDLVQSGQLLNALLLETAAWLCIEDATRQFKVQLREEVQMQGERITSSMGPGCSYKIDGQMCTWSLEEQIDLFRLFDGNDLSVTVMANCAMRPKMSRSGLIGVGFAQTPKGGNCEGSSRLVRVFMS